MKTFINLTLLKTHLNHTPINTGEWFTWFEAVGSCSWVGIGASVKQCLQIGSNVVVGAGAAVVADVADGLTVVGVPAKALVR